MALWRCTGSGAEKSKKVRGFEAHLTDFWRSYLGLASRGLVQVEGKTIKGSMKQEQNLLPVPSPMLKPSATIHHSADFLCTLIETEIAHAVQPYQNALASIEVTLAAHCLAITDNQLVFVGARAKALASLDAVVKGFVTDPTTYKPISFRRGE
ncbi:hypothetical protein B0H14DRAFT_2563903 [Mycena olivaceomarginata]|nr:hypothetical protein B0H14DRAFT_2563903 [Mycena olivaceomarginata]